MIKKILIMTFVLSFLYSCSELKDKFSDDTEKKDQIIENNIQIEEKNQTNNVNVESIEITKENLAQLLFHILFLKQKEEKHHKSLSIKIMS